MATWTSTQLATQVLKELGVVGVGQTASAEDLDKVTHVWPSIYRRLRNAGVADWTAEAIGEESQHPLARYVAAEVAFAFGFRGQELADIKNTHGFEGWLGLQEAAAADAHPAPPKFLDY